MLKINSDLLHELLDGRVGLVVEGLHLWLPEDKLGLEAPPDGDDVALFLRSLRPLSASHEVGARLAALAQPSLLGVHVRLEHAPIRWLHLRLDGRDRVRLGLRLLADRSQPKVYHRGEGRLRYRRDLVPQRQRLIVLPVLAVFAIRDQDVRLVLEPGDDLGLEAVDICVVGACAVLAQGETLGPLVAQPLVGGGLVGRLTR